MAGVSELGEQPGGAVPPVPVCGRRRRLAAADFRRIAMSNEALVSMTGYVATQPKYRMVGNGASVVSMRVAWTPRYIDRGTGEWVDGNTSYLTVSCWRKLADNVAMCLRKGDPVVVKGRLSVRAYEKDGMPRTEVDVDASSVGHDLSRGVAHFQRTKRVPGETAAGPLVPGFASGGLGDEGLRRGDGMPDISGGGTADEPAGVGAGNGASPGNASSGLGGELAGQPAADIFDESAIAELAAEHDAVSAPF
jgi:single-strand DNA-binding protein